MHKLQEMPILNQKDDQIMYDVLVEQLLMLEIEIEIEIENEDEYVLLILPNELLFDWIMVLYLKYLDHVLDLNDDVLQ